MTKRNPEIVWASLYKVTAQHAELIAKICRPEIADLIMSVSKRFVDIPLPIGSEQIATRQRQRDAVNSIIRSLRHADTMSQKMTLEGSELLAKCQDLATMEFPTTTKQITAREFDFISTVRQLCS